MTTSTDERRAIRIARAEVLAPTCALSRQLLAPHEIDCDDDGQPRVARVHCSPDACHVYFPIRGQRFTFVVVVRDEPVMFYIEADTRVHLDVRSETVMPEEITRRVGIEPTSSCGRGEIRRGTMRSKVHQWSLEHNRDLPGPVEEKLERLLAVVEPHADAFAALRPECTIGISVMYDNWRGDPQFGGIAFSDEIVQRTAALGASIDIDLYASGSGEL